jgi:hypothetical protein
MVNANLVALKNAPCRQRRLVAAVLASISLSPPVMNHPVVHLHNADSETPPAIEPFQALPRTVTLCRIAP